MKHHTEVTACVVDYGTFLCVAERLAQEMAHVYYYSPHESEYLTANEIAVGQGFNFEWVENPFDINADLYVFPDIGFAGLQRMLRKQGKAVWGNMGATELELSRSGFLTALREVGLPTVESQIIYGMAALREFLKKVENVWVKVNMFRGDMETWHHENYKQSQRYLDHYDMVFGGMKEKVVFVVQESIKADRESGYDGWIVDGQYPLSSFQGYEKKNELYLGCVTPYSKLPEELREVNEKMAHLLMRYGYRGWWATEVRVAGDEAYFIDPTPRLGGLSGEQTTETMANFAEVIWAGANGELVRPLWNWDYAAVATMHYTMEPKTHADADWMTLEIPHHMLPWFKPYHAMKEGDTYHFIPGSDEVGVLVGVGSTAQDAIDHLVDNLEEVKDLPLHAEIAGFASLLDDIAEAESQGVSFGTRVPRAEDIFKDKKLRKEL